MVKRVANFTKSQSFFLFGPRGTGKSTLLKERYDEEKALYVDLLDIKTEDLYRTNPDELRHRILARNWEWVIIDEVQKLPRLLDIVHSLIEEKKAKFILSGSSARKLKRGLANLLAGRAFVYHLHPLTFVELGSLFSLQEAMEWGTLPKLLELPEVSDKEEFLRAYALTYLKEEIQLEQLVRNLDPFRNFLEVAAQSNGEIVNYARIARDVGVDTTTVQSYFSILEDTLIGFLLPAYGRSIRKRQRKNPKFYFFDVGVTRALSRTLGSRLVPQTYGYGRAFEQFVILEIMRLANYARKDWAYSYLRTKDGVEMDLIIECGLENGDSAIPSARRWGKRTVCIEIKSSTQIRAEHVASFATLSRDLPGAEAMCLSLDPYEKKIGHVICLHWREGLKRLGLC